MRVKSAISIASCIVITLSLLTSWNDHTVSGQGANPQEVASQVIAASEGGSISASFPDRTKIDVEIVRGALSKDERISIVAKPKRDVPNPGRAAVIFGEYAIDLRPHNLQLNVPCLLRITHQQELMRPSPQIQEIGVYFFDEGEKLWRPLTVVEKNPEKSEVAVVIDRLTVIAILGTTVKVTALEINDPLRPGRESRLTLYYVAGGSGGDIQIFSGALSIDAGLPVVPSAQERAFQLTAHPLSPTPGEILIKADSTELYRQRILVDRPQIADAERLLRMYAPTLRFAEGENFFPTAIENDFKYGTVKLRRSVPFRLDEVEDEFWCYDAFSKIAKVLGRKAATGFYLDFPEKADPKCRPTGEPVVYATAIECEDHNLIALQYWFHYYKDDKLFSPHGDFEMVTVFLDRTTRRPVKMTFSQHFCKKSVAWEQVQKQEGTHPVVFVAKGSHASYHTADTTFVETSCLFQTPPILYDDHKGDGLQLSFNEYELQILPRLLEVNSSSLTAWLLYSGRWGAESGLPTSIGISPNTPPFLSDSIRWFDPCGWAGFAAPRVPTLPNWVPGDGHVHTDQSWWDWNFWNWLTTPVALTPPTLHDQAKAAKDRGLRWIIVTDHEEMYITPPPTTTVSVCADVIKRTSHSQDYLEEARQRWEQQARFANLVEDKLGIKVMLGEEVGCVHALPYYLLCPDRPPLPTSHGHYLAYNINSYVGSFPYNTYTMQNAVNNHRGLGFIAHPRGILDILGPNLYEWDGWPGTFSGATGLEIMNGGESTRVAEPGGDWDKLLISSIGKNKHPVGIGNSDAHWDGRKGHEDQYPGKSLTYLYIEGELTHESIYQALEQGRAVASNGPLLVFEIQGKNIGETVEVNPGGRLTLNIRWVSTVEFGKMKEIDVIWNGQRLETLKVNSLSGGISRSYTKFTQSGYFRLVGRTEVGRTGKSHSAYTNPIWVNVSAGECNVPGLTEREPNNDRGSATPITPTTVGTTLVGVICPEGDVDFFSFNATSGQLFSIRTIARDLNPPSDADTLLTLFDSNGNVLAENDDYGGSLDSLLIFAAPVTGRYYIRVSNAVDGGGPNYIYHLVVTRLSSSTISSEPPLDDYSTVPVSVEAIGAVTPIVPNPLLRSGTLLPATNTQSLANRVGVIHSNPGAKTIVADSVQKPRAHTSGKGREPPCCKE